MQVNECSFPASEIPIPPSPSSACPNMWLVSLSQDLQCDLSESVSETVRANREPTDCSDKSFESRVSPVNARGVLFYGL